MLTVRGYILTRNLQDDVVLFICDTKGELILEAEVGIIKQMCPPVLDDPISDLTKAPDGRYYIEVG